MLQFITASIAHFEVGPPASKFATVIYTLRQWQTHMKTPLFKLQGYMKIYLTLNAVLARSMEKTTMVPQYLQFGHRSNEEKKRKKALYTTHSQAGSHSLVINLTLTLTSS